jgi:hypothetical protein
VASLVRWFDANRLLTNVSKTDVIVFGRNRHLITSVKVRDANVPCSASVKFLGLRTDNNIRTGHINYVGSRVKHVSHIFTRFSGAFDRRMRLYLAAVLAVPIVGLYDFIYGATSATNLRHPDVAYNDLMRSIAGARRCIRTHTVDLYAQTGFDESSVRRDRSLVKFIVSVINESMCSRIPSPCVKSHHGHSLRINWYILFGYATSIEKQRITVKGLNCLTVTVKTEQRALLYC